MTLPEQKALTPGTRIYDPNDGITGMVIEVSDTHVFIVWNDWTGRCGEFYDNNCLSRSRICSLREYELFITKNLINSLIGELQ